MKSTRIDIASIRKEQITDAASAVIAEQGIQNLSLSEIEHKAGMSRGQLTYYFPTKEAILLAVFDRLLELMCQRMGAADGRPNVPPGGWEVVQYLVKALIGQPPLSPAFHCLQYTFLSQIGHREDFRQRLATLYEEWRSHLARELGDDPSLRPAARTVSPRALATLVQAILHGLAMQRAADPDAFDRQEMVDLCLDVLGRYLRGRSPGAKKRKSATKKVVAANGSPTGAAARAAVPRRR